MARGIGWVAPDNLHLTLKFLGQVAEPRLDAIVASLRGAVGDVASFDATVSGLGAFPSAARARVVWAGVAAGAERMIELARRVDAALAALGFPPEARPFSPHVTLGRVRAPQRDPALAVALADGRERQFGTVRVERLVLMQSHLSPRGSRYAELADIPLR